MLRARKPDVDTSNVPRHWFGGSPVATHIANGVNMLFPAGERFFVRSVNHFKDRITDPVLSAEIRGFFGQEGRHAQAHESDLERLRKEGYRIDDFLKTYERIAFGVLEKLSGPELNLAGTAAAEHFTALMAEGALKDGNLREAHPDMRKLLEWHAAEEIEHKHVAFDVLQAINPSYALRVAGLAMATLTLVSFWVAATANLLRQDGYTLKKFRDELKRVESYRPESRVRGVFGRGIREYLRRDFHPRQNDNYHLARKFLEDAGYEKAA